MALGANVKKFREDAQLTQTQLADMAGMDQQALAALEKRDSKSSSFAASLAAALGISIDELMGVAPAANKPNKAGAVTDNRVWIGLYDYSGNESAPWQVREARTLPFHADFFRDKGVDPNNCRLLTARGRSMAPYINDRDIYMVDSAEHCVRDGEIYAIYYEHELLVKQIFKLPGGGLRLHSFNHHEYPDRDISGDQLEYVRIIGRQLFRAG